MCGVRYEPAGQLGGSYAADLAGVNESSGLFVSSTVTDKGVVHSALRLPVGFLRHTD